MSDCKVMNSVIYSQMLQENKKRRRENEKANEVKNVNILDNRILGIIFAIFFQVCNYFKIKFYLNKL